MFSIRRNWANNGSPAGSWPYNPNRRKAVAKKKKAKKKSSRSKKAAAEVLLVGSKVKAAIKGAGCNTGGDSLDALNNYVHWLVGQATARARANNRKTVRAHDFLLM